MESKTIEKTITTTEIIYQFDEKELMIIDEMIISFFDSKYQMYSGELIKLQKDVETAIYENNL